MRQGRGDLLLSCSDNLLIEPSLSIIQSSAAFTSYDFSVSFSVIMARAVCSPASARTRVNTNKNR